MRKIIPGLAASLSLATAAVAQVPSFPQTIPSQTVVGRLSPGPGPTEAIPFSVLTTQAIITPPLTLTPVGTTQGLSILHTISGNIQPGVNGALNVIAVTNDTAALGAQSVIGLKVSMVLNQAGYSGERFGAFFQVFQNHVSTSTFDLAYVGNTSQAYTNTGDGGGVGTEKGGYFGENPICYLDTGATNVSNCVGVESNTQTAAGVTFKHAWAYSAASANSAAGTLGIDAAYEMHGIGVNGSFGPHHGWDYGLLADDQGGPSPFKATAKFIGANFPTLGTQTIAVGVDMRTNLAFTGNAFQSPGFGVDANGNIINTGWIATHTPLTLTSTPYTLSVADSSLIINVAGATTLTLPAPATYPGRWIYVKTIQAQTVVSASANVVARATAAAGTAILAAAAGNWAALQSDGTNWVLMAGTP